MHEAPALCNLQLPPHPRPERRPCCTAHTGKHHGGNVLCCAALCCTYLPHTVKGVCLPVEAHQLVPAACDTCGPHRTAVQGQGP